MAFGIFKVFRHSMLFLYLQGDCYLPLLWECYFENCMLFCIIEQCVKLLGELYNEEKARLLQFPYGAFKTTVDIMIIV